MTTSMFKNHYYNLRDVIYKTEYGLIFEDFKTKIFFFTYDSTPVDVSMTRNNLPTNGQNIGYLQIGCSPIVSNYSRSYIKGQAVIANIGGIIKANLMMARIVSNYLTSRMSYVDLSNTVFQYKICEKNPLGYKGQINYSYLKNYQGNAQISKF